MKQQPVGVLETSVYATDLAAAERFYADGLGLTVHAREEGRHVFFRCGAGMFLVFNPETTAQGSQLDDGSQMAPHGAHGPSHMAFRIREEEFAAWRTRLEQAGVAIESEIRWPNGGLSLYFRDPAGNSIELATARLWGLPE
jgi:catechol 2,3-dioxygenase-like lactoylglutathione lyase family enzyme